MLSIEEILDSDANTALSGFDIPTDYDGLLALKTLAETGQPLPSDTLDVLATMLLDATQAELHEGCADILAYCAWHHQLLPDSAIRILEATLEFSDDNLLNIVASALSGVLNNGQVLAPYIIQLTEEALIRQQQSKLNIAGFLYQLVKKLKKNELSAATYEELCNIILEINLALSHHMDLVNNPLETDDEDDEETDRIDKLLNTHEYCCNIIAAIAGQGDIIPSLTDPLKLI